MFDYTYLLSYTQILPSYIIFYPLSSIPVMLLLPLIGNSSAERSAELGLVQSKLRNNRVRYKSQIDLFNSQADEQEKALKARRKEEEDRRVEKESIEAALESQLLAVSHSPPTAIDLNVFPTVNSPTITPPEPLSNRSSRPTTPSVQFSPLTSIIPCSSSSCSSHDLGCSSSDAELSPANSRMGSSSTDDGSSKLLITFGTFPAVRVTPTPRRVAVEGLEYMPSVPRSIPPTSCGIADLSSLTLNQVTNFDSTQIRRNNPLLRPKSMGHILDQQVGRLAPSSSSNIRRVKKEKNVLNVLFSAPLAWRDRSGRLHPLEMLDYGAERLELRCMYCIARTVSDVL